MHVPSCEAENSRGLRIHRCMVAGKKWALQVHGRSKGRAKSRDRKIGNEGFKKDERGKGVLRQKGSERRDGDIPATLLSVHNPALGTHAWTHRGLFLLLSAWETKQEFHRFKSTDQSRNVDKEDHSSPVQDPETLCGIYAFLKCRNELTRQTKGKEGDGIMAAHRRALCLIILQAFWLST